jgi:hypothetical protein
MCWVRVYLPATLPGLAVAGAGGAMPPAAVEVAAAGSTACAVTPALREWYREGGLEELEYVALTRAALLSLRLVAEVADADRRVVLAADVPDFAVVLEPDADPAAVRLGAAVQLDQVLSAHVDDPRAAADVRAAAGLLSAVDAGDDDACFAIDSLDDHELQWYAAQEIAFLLG